MMQENFIHSQIAGSFSEGYQSCMELKINIREIRKQRGYTIAELAEMIGVSTPHLSEVERGKKNLNNHLMTRLASALEVKHEDLVASSSAKLDRVNAIAQKIGKLSQPDQARIDAFAEMLLASQASDQQD